MLTFQGFLIMKMTHKMVILDEIMAQLEAADSGLDEQSVKLAKVSGIQNVPTSINQKTIGGASSTCFTTFPLSPLSENCCIDKSYLYFDFDVNLGLEIVVKNTKTLKKGTTFPLYIGFRDTHALFNQIQFLIEGSTIWQTVYQREESVLAYNSLPDDLVQNSKQYATIDNLRFNKESPMYRIEVTFNDNDFTAEGGDKPVVLPIKINYKLTVDLNRLTPLLSNLHYTTPHMGNLRLKVFIQELEKAMFFCPDYSAFGQNDLIVKMNQYWQFYPLNKFYDVNLIGSDAATLLIPIVYRKDGSPGLCVGGNENIASIKFTKAPNAEDSFLSFARGNAEIIQTTFAIKGTEFNRLTDYFTSLGSVIIPTSVWSTNVFNNSNIPQGQWNSTMIGNIGGYNIDTVAIWTHPLGNPCCMTKEYLTGIQCLIEGRPINPVPYECFNDEFITDSSQAIADTDACEVNDDYARMLSLFNQKDGEFYTNADPATWIPNITTAKGINKDNIGIANNFVMYFSTNLPDAFHSGACILEKTLKQSVIRLISNRKSIGSSHYPYIVNGENSQLVVGFSCLCDACIVLSYDPARNTCFTGQLSWAAPYA